jgi:hypothetical protein
MPGPGVVELIAQITHAVDTITARYRAGDVTVADIEGLKGTIDAARLRLWGLLKAVHQDADFEQRFRIHRVTEMATRLAQDLELELVRGREGDLEALDAAAQALSRAVARVRSR